MKYRINKQKIVNDSDSIRVLDLPERLFDILNSYNVTTISQLKALSWDTVEQLKGIGMASQIKVMSVVSQLKQAEKEIEEKKEDILKTLDIQTKNSNSSKKTEKHSAITTPMIFHIYQKYHLEEMDFHLYENRNCISKNGIQLFSINDDKYKICFTNSNIHEQIELDRINEEFGIDVHFGNSDNYQVISWNISNCNIVNNTSSKDLTRGYFVCEPLNEENAITLLYYLIDINGLFNSIKSKGESLDGFASFLHIIKQCDYENTYKMALAKSFVEIACEKDSFEDLTIVTVEESAEKFLKYYWNQTILFDFIQGSNPERVPVVLQSVKQLIKHYQLTYEKKIVYYSIAKKTFESYSDSKYWKTIKEIAKTIERDVAWRFTSIDKRNADEVLVFDKENHCFVFSKEVMNQIKNNQSQLNDLINYRWEKILETFNNANVEKKKIKIEDNETIDRKKLVAFESLFEPKDKNEVLHNDSQAEEVQAENNKENSENKDADNSLLEVEIIKYNPLKPVKEGKEYYPALLVIKNKIYRVTNWQDAFKILMYYHAYKENKVDSFYELIDKTINKSLGVLIGSSEIMEENQYFSKFSPNLYIHVYKSTKENYKLLHRIHKWVGDFEFYVVRADYLVTPSLINSLIDEKAKTLLEEKKYKNGSTKHLIASINGKILNEKEKLYVRIGREFDRTTLIGDIEISEKEEAYLKSYMNKAISFMQENGKMYHHDKVFAYGMVRAALKRYSSKRFWPYVEEEYGVSLPANDQSSINTAFRNTLRKYNKLYFDEEESNYVQNMCMHAFACDKCADQLFDYIFEFWRIDLARSIENSIDEDGEDLFEILIDEIKSNKDVGVQDIMMHTTMALQMNPVGCKNRFRRILKMIDNSYWNNTDYSKSKNRITYLFNQWKDNKKSLFYKDIKSSISGRKHGRGEKLLSRPSIIFDQNTKGFSIVMPKQVLRNCTVDEHPFWRIIIDDEEYITVPVELIQGKASLYSEECLVGISKTDIYKKIEVLLQSEKANYYRRTIKEDDCRFFNNKYRNIDIGYDYLSKDACLAFVKDGKKLQYLNGEFTEFDSFDDISDIYVFNANEGDVFILPNNHAIPVGRQLQEGIIGNSTVKGVRAKYNDNVFDITSNRERLFFKADKRQFNGTSIRVLNDEQQIYFGKVLDKEYVEFTLDESIEDIYGYFVDLHKYISGNGIYTVELSIPGTILRQYKQCYIKGFNYSFENAPYIFEDTGEISFPSHLNIATDNNWILSQYKKTLVFEIDENGKDENEYIKDRKLYLRYLFDDKEIELEFDLPVLYWKYKSTDSWMFGKPQDMNSRDVPERIYIDGDLDLPSAKLYIKNDDDLEIPELSSTYDNKTGLYYFRMLDITGSLNRELVSRILMISINGKDRRFMNIVCKSFVVSKNITGDFDSNIIYGNFEIIGSSDYIVNVYFENEKIGDSISLENGKFQLEYEVKEGNYKVVIYEIEEDDSGFDSVSYFLEEYEFELKDSNNLEGKYVYIKTIKDISNKYAPLPIKKESYRFLKIHRLKYYQDLLIDKNLYSWKYYPEDENTVSKFLFYEGTFGFVNSNRQFVKVGKGLLIFNNLQNLGEALVYIYDDEEEGYISMIYSPNKRCLLPNSNTMTKYERRKARSIDDDLYKAEVEIR